MNKRGEEMVMKNVISLLIAAVVIGFIVFLIFRGFYFISKGNEAESAKRTLEGLMGKIDNLKDGQEGKFTLQGFSSKDRWYFVGFDSRDEIDEKPGECSFDSCVCICPKGGADKGKLCAEGGFCEKIGDKNVNILFLFGDAKLEGSIIDFKIPIGESLGCIPIMSNLFEVSVFKESDNLKLASEGEFVQGDLFYERCRKIYQ